MNRIYVEARDRMRPDKALSRYHLLLIARMLNPRTLLIRVVYYVSASRDG